LEDIILLADNRYNIIYHIEMEQHNQRFPLWAFKSGQLAFYDIKQLKHILTSIGLPTTFSYSSGLDLFVYPAERKAVTVVRNNCRLININ